MRSESPLSLRLLLISHLTRDTFLGFSAGIGLTVTLLHHSLLLHGLTTLAKLIRNYVLLGYARHIVVLCVTLGFGVWARRFLFTTPRYLAAPFKTLESTEIQSSPPANVGLAPHVSLTDIAQGLVLRKTKNGKVVKVGSNIVVKLGSDVDEAEAESMTFIRAYTTIPVPKVLGTYEDDGCRYILMDFVEGESLASIWDGLSSTERSVILDELRDYIRQMRQIKRPNGALIGSVTGGPAIDRRQLGPATGGPFKSETDFNEWQLAQLYEDTPLSHRDTFAALHRTDHKIVFSHGDLAFHNIIVYEGHIAAIIDWQYSGWYPEHWDYCKTRSFLSGTDELYTCCKRIFEKQYYAEYFMDEWFTREVRHGGF